jgi:hypothetical protein
MGFKISGLPVAEFSHLLSLDDEALDHAGVTRCIVDAAGSYPCRITLEDAEPGEEMLLLNYAHQSAQTPYASTGPIFVRRNARSTRVVVNEVPDQQRSRLLSVRAYDASGWMTDADVMDGTDLESLIARFLGDPNVDYLHVHNARRGCYACRVDRA